MTDTPFNLTRYCLEAAASDPEAAARPAFTFVRPDGAQTWTYREAWETVSRIGRVFLDRGLRKGDRILIRLPQSPEYAFAFFGASLAGLIPVPASPQLTSEEAAFLLSDTEARGAVTSPALRLSGFDGVEVSQEALWQLDADAEFPSTMAEDPAYLVYTSGTTAKPKGVLHAHRTVLGRALMRDSWQGFGPNDVTLHAGTLNWAFTTGTGLMDPWAARSHAVLYGGPPDPTIWLPLLERYGVTVFTAVPTLLRQILKYGRPEEADLSRLRHALSGGEPPSVEILSEWERRTGAPVYEAFGMTELSTFISSGSAAPTKPGSPGKPQPGRRVAVLPENGGETPLPPGEIGFLAMDRSDPGFMLRYWRRPEENVRMTRGEWFVGGDRVSMDEDGYIWYHGRVDDMITAFGYRLSPVEIEAVLEKCPGVEEAAVVGVTVAEMKTIVTACVLPRAGASLSEETLAAHAAAHLAQYKRPRQYRIVETLPRTRNGKLQRRALLQQLLAGGAPSPEPLA